MRRFILGTDWWTDCDDAVAIRLIARSHIKGECELLGVVINACMEDSVSSLDNFLRSEGVCDIPIGLDREATDFGGRPPYQKRLSELHFDSRKNSDAEDPIRLYRRLLSEQRTSVEMIEIGYLQTVAALLKSAPDDISPLDGRALVKEKVSHIWVMAGKWDEPLGRENNFARNPRARLGGADFCRLCPVPVTFLGWEVGASVKTGGNLPCGDALHSALVDHGSENGRSSWDPMLLLLALIGDERTAGYYAVRGSASVDPESGENTFEESMDGLHTYVVKTMPDEWYEERINGLL